MECNSGSNRESDFKSAERIAQGWFETTSTITPELYDMKSCYQLIVNNEMQETFLTVEKRLSKSKENVSE